VQGETGGGKVRQEAHNAGVHEARLSRRRQTAHSAQQEKERAAASLPCRMNEVSELETQWCRS